MKTNKALSKRLRVTPSGKIMARRGGKNHFNAKESRSKQLSGKKQFNFKMKSKDISRYLAN